MNIYIMCVLFSSELIRNITMVLTCMSTGTVCINVNNISNYVFFVVFIHGRIDRCTCTCTWSYQVILFLLSIFWINLNWIKLSNLFDTCVFTVAFRKVQTNSMRFNQCDGSIYNNENIVVLVVVCWKINQNRERPFSTHHVYSD